MHMTARLQSGALHLNEHLPRHVTHRINQAEARVAFCITPDALPDLGVGAVYRQRHEYCLQAQMCQLSLGYMAVHRVEEGIVCSQPIEVAVDGPRPQQPWQQFVEFPAAAQLLSLSRSLQILQPRNASPSAH